MELPTTQDAFCAVFGQRNSAIWPLMLLFYLLGAASVALLLWPSRFAPLFRLAHARGDVARQRRGASLNVLPHDQSGRHALRCGLRLRTSLLILVPLRHGGLRFRVRQDERPVAGALLVPVAALICPLWVWLAGRVRSQMQAFGVAPCPTTIFGIGVFILGIGVLPTGSRKAVRRLLTLPGLRAAVG